jgi:hypothetical protein
VFGAAAQSFVKFVSRNRVVIMQCGIGRHTQKREKFSPYDANVVILDSAKSNVMNYLHFGDRIALVIEG